MGQTVTIIGLGDGMSPQERVAAILRRFNYAVSDYIAQSQSDLPAALRAIGEENMGMPDDPDPETILRCVHMSAFVALLIDAYFVCQDWGISWTDAVNIASHAAANAYSTTAREWMFNERH